MNYLLSLRNLPCRFAVAFFILTGFSTANSSEWSGRCQVTFAGKSTWHDFEGKVDSEPFTVRISNLEDPAKATASATLIVKVAKMDTENKKRDEAMRKVLDAGSHPVIQVVVKDLVPEKTKPLLDGPVPQPTVIPFILQIKGKKLELTGKISDWSFSSDRISYTIRFPVSLKAAEVKPPSALGLLKVDDRIDVSAKVTLTK